MRTSTYEMDSFMPARQAEDNEIITADIGKEKVSVSLMMRNMPTTFDILSVPQL
jgi:hypothetical protein